MSISKRTTTCSKILMIFLVLILTTSTCSIFALADTKDTVAPTIQIKSPNIPVVTASKTTINIAGIASDNAALANITWKNNEKNVSGTCSGSTSWKADAVPLKDGRNVIVVTAKDTSGNTSSASLVVNATLPLLANISASPIKIMAGEEVTLTWSSVGAVKVSSSNFGAADIKGTMKLKPSQNTTYYLTVQNETGRKASIKTTVFVTQLADPQVKIEAKYPIVEGQSTILKWMSTNATGIVKSSFGANQLSGSMSISPTKTTTYSITVKSINGKTAGAQCTVVVNPRKE